MLRTLSSCRKTLHVSPLAKVVDNLELFRAAVNLRVGSLIKAISASFATKIFFLKNDVKDYQAKRDGFKIREITHDDSRVIADEFPLLNK